MSVLSITHPQLQDIIVGSMTETTESLEGLQLATEGIERTTNCGYVSILRSDKPPHWRRPVADELFDLFLDCFTVTRRQRDLDVDGCLEADSTSKLRPNFDDAKQAWLIISPSWVPQSSVVSKQCMPPCASRYASSTIPIW